METIVGKSAMARARIKEAAPDYISSLYSSMPCTLGQRGKTLASLKNDVGEQLNHPDY